MNNLEEANAVAVLLEADIISRNEAREQIGLPPVEDGDKFYRDPRQSAIIG